jgi:hypothetical protein
MKVMQTQWEAKVANVTATANLEAKTTLELLNFVLGEFCP